MIRFEDIYETVKRHHAGADLEVLRKAYIFSAVEHKGQTRACGEPYLVHPLEVAAILAELRMDPACVAVGLLHDVLEDTLTDADKIKEHFGADVLHIVEGVTKISKIPFSSSEERQAENFRKLLLAMVDDVRVIIVKLADRLHNMRTLQYLPEERRVRIARETMDIYAPLAGRLGMSKIKNELEDLSFQYLEPESYRELTAAGGGAAHAGHRVHREDQGHGGGEARRRRAWRPPWRGASSACTPSTRSCASSASTSTRSTTSWPCASWWPPSPTATPPSGVLHNLWRPVPGRIKDFIAMPRPNGYRSLHTSVISDEGHPFEVQIRTREMHRIAEEGIAAHWKYKEGRSGPDKDDQAFAWLRQLLEWQQEVKDPHEFLNSLKLDLYPEEVYCFTPRGEVKTLPAGRHPHRLRLRHPHRGRPPVRGRARERQDRAPALQAEERRHHRDPHLGRPQPEPRLAGPGRHQQGALEDPPLPQHGGEAAGARDRQEALRARAQALRPLRCRRWRPTKAEAARPRARRGHASSRTSTPPSATARSRCARCWPSLLPAGEAGGAARRPRSRARITDAVKRLLRVGEERITVKGSGDLLIYRAKCCNPIMGEPIVGYITRGKGVSVHAQTCPNVVNLMYDPERRIAVEWERGGEGAYEVRIAVQVEDRPGAAGRHHRRAGLHEHGHPHGGGARPSTTAPRPST